MITDALLLFSDSQAITAATASTSYVDLGAVRNPGVGANLYVQVSIDVAFTDSGSDSTLTVALQGDSTAGSFTPDGTQQLFIIPALAAAGNKYYARISPDFASAYRYLQLYYTPNNGNLTTGSVTASIVDGIQAEQVYAKNYTIS